MYTFLYIILVVSILKELKEQIWNEDEERSKVLILSLSGQKTL